MEVSMNQAAITAVFSFFIGALLGAIYDIIRIFRAAFGVSVKNPFKKGKIGVKAIFGYLFVALGDFLFFVIMSAVMCVFFFLTGDGRARGYALLLAFFGFLAYYNTLGRVLISSAAWVFGKVRGIICLCFRACAARLCKLKIIFDMHIVKTGIKRYNDYISKRKKRARMRATAKAKRRGGSFVNSVYGTKKGGSHGQ